MNRYAKIAADLCSSYEDKEQLLLRLSKGFVPLFSFKHYLETVDDFFEQFLNPDERVALFQRLHPLTAHPVDIVEVGSRNVNILIDAARGESSRCSYLESITRQLETPGYRGLCLLNFLRSNPGALDIDHDSLKSRIAFLAEVLSYPTFFRDGFLRHFERQILPDQFSLSTFEQLAIRHLESVEATKTWIRSGLIQAPLEWQKLEQLDLLRTTPAQRDLAMDFYKIAIPMCRDPQLQLRMSCTAIKIWRFHNNAPLFQDQLAAIETFFPEPSELRDTQIYALIDQHTVGGEGVPIKTVQLALHLRTGKQGLVSHENWTRLNACTQAFDSIISAIRQDERRALLFWALEPNKYPKPQSLILAEDKKNVTFDELPSHLLWAPRPVRQQIVNRLLLGEHGLLTATTPGEVTERLQLLADLFDFILPVSENRPSDTGIDASQLGILKDVFITVMSEYTSERGAVIIEDLIDREVRYQITGAVRPSFSERLTTLFTISPTFIKLAQILSEKDDLVVNQRARELLGVLTVSAPPLAKVPILETILSAGIPVTDFELGAAISVASMKQVHRGRYRCANRWNDAAFRVIKTDVIRALHEDTQAGRRAAEMLMRKHGIDVRQVIETAIRILREESQLEVEFDHTQRFRGSLPSNPFIQVPGTLSDRSHAVKGVIVDRFISSDQRYRAAARLRSEFLRQLLSGEYVHADLHRGNHLSDQYRSYLIDFGLVVQLSDSDHQAVAQIAKGIILRDSLAIANGFAAFCGISADMFSQSELKGALRAKSLSALLTDLGRVLQSIDAQGDRREKLNTLIKGICNARWLFPLDLLNAPSTFSDCARALQLNWKERASAGTRNLDFVIYETVGSVAARVHALFLDPLSDLFTKGMRGIRFAQRWLGKALRTADKSGTTTSPFLGKRDQAWEKDPSQTIIESAHSKIWFNAHSLRDAEQNQYLREWCEREKIDLNVAQTFCRAFRYFMGRLKRCDLIMPRQSLGAESEVKLLRLRNFDDTKVFLSAALSDLLLAKLYTQDQLGGFTPFYSPSLRVIAQELAQAYINAAAPFYRAGVMQRELDHLRLFLEDLSIAEVTNILTAYLGNSRRREFDSDLSLALPNISSIKIEAQYLDYSWTKSLEVREAVQSLDLSIIDTWESKLIRIGESHFAILGCREGYNHGGRVGLKLHWIEGGESVEIRCSDVEAGALIDTGALPEHAICRRST